jgi:hypothetical protein
MLQPTQSACNQRGRRFPQPELPISAAGVADQCSQVLQRQCARDFEGFGDGTFSVGGSKSRIA